MTKGRLGAGGRHGMGAAEGRLVVVL